MCVCNLVVIVCFVFCCSGGRFFMILVSFWCHFCPFWRHFSVLGGLLATLGLPGDPPKGPRQKGDEKVGSWVLPGGSQFQRNPRKIEKKSLRGGRWKALCPRCCTRGASGPPPTMKTMVSCTRNHRFHSSPGGPKHSEMVSNWYLLGHLRVVFGALG